MKISLKLIFEASLALFKLFTKALIFITFSLGTDEWICQVILALIEEFFKNIFKYQGRQSGLRFMTTSSGRLTCETYKINMLLLQHVIYTTREIKFFNISVGISLDLNSWKVIIHMVMGMANCEENRQLSNQSKKSANSGMELTDFLHCFY